MVRKRLTSTWGRGGNHIHDLVYFDARWGFECLEFEVILTKLLLEDEDLEAQDETGCTPLLNACYLGCTRSFNLLLLRKGANVHAVDTEGWNAIHQILYRINYYCEQYGDCEIVPQYERFVAEGVLDLLLSSGCSPTVASKNGNMPFHLMKFDAPRWLWRDILFRRELPEETIRDATGEAWVCSKCGGKVCRSERRSLNSVLYLQ